MFNKDEIIEMAKHIATTLGSRMCDENGDTHGEELYCMAFDDIVDSIKLVAAKEREALEVELLKLKQGVAANSDYIQGRWDLIGEFQDIIRSRS
jgi:hypothetical protein